MHQFISLWQT